jgi:Ca2+/H+ antiporter, TMEM165/GDT1 family
MGKHIPERAIKWVSALIFIAFGVYGLYESLPTNIWSPLVLTISVSALAAAIALVARMGAGKGRVPVCGNTDAITQIRK